ncbi:MAG: ABC transporter permease [Candidatus Bipolaricaulia bacterium]
MTAVTVNRRAKFTRIALVVFPLAFLVAFFYYPLTAIFRDGVIDHSGFTLRYLGEIAADPYFRDLIGFTIKQALLSTLVSIALGFPAAYILTRYDFPFKNAIRSLTIVPFVLPAITVALGFIIAFGNNGFLNRTLMDLFGVRVRILYSLQGIVLAHAFYNAPIITRTVHAAWERIDPSYEESARALGASRFAVFRDVTLRMLMPGLMSGALLAFIFSFLSFPIVLALGGARYSTLEVEIYIQVRTMLNYNLGAALAIVETFVSLGFAYLYIKAEDRFSLSFPSTRRRRTEPLFAFSPGRILVFAFIALNAVIFLGPIFSVVYDSVTRDLAGERIYTLYWYSFIFSPDYDAIIGDPPLRSVLNSLSFAAMTALIAVPLGVAISVIVRKRGRRQTGLGAVETLVMAPLAISSVALGLGLLRAFNRPPLAISGTWVVIVLAHTILAYPFVIRVVRPVLESIDRNLIEAGRSLGASRWRTFFDIELPLITVAVGVGAVFAFAISIAEMSAAIMLARPGLKTMPVTLYHLLAARNFGAASAMGVLLITITGIAFVLIEGLGASLLRRGAKAERS